MRISSITLITAALTALSAPVAQAVEVCDGSWQVVTGPSAPVSWYPGDIAVTRDDVWATGQDDQGAVVAHRAHGEWSVEQVESALIIEAIAARPGAVWAVGLDFDTSGPAVFTRRDSTWQRVDVPVRGDDGLSGVQMTSARNIWISGTTSDARGQPKPLVLHFDGVKWTRYVMPEHGFGYAVETRGSNDAWIAGVGPSPRTGYVSNAAAWRWNGRRWTFERLDDAITNDSSFSGIAATRHGDVWAIGEAQRTTKDDHILRYGILARWTPSGWSRVAFPTGCIHCEPLDLLVGAGASVTVFGWDSLALIYNGGRWEPIKAPDAPDANWKATDSDGQGNAWTIPLFESPGNILLHRCV